MKPAKPSLWQRMHQRWKPDDEILAIIAACQEAEKRAADDDCPILGHQPSLQDFRSRARKR
jgi:hypothetical protein